jgi:hypothetical protein
MSDTEMTFTPNTTESIHKTPGRMEKVPEYHGKRDLLEQWILHCDLHFHVHDDIPEENKGPLASSRLRGDAFKWITPHLQRYMDNTIKDAENTLMFEDWDEFKKKIKQVFGVHKETVVAERKIQELRQTHSVADYVNQFKQYSIQIDWDQNALKRMFRQGLKPQVREELMRTNAVTETVDELIDESIRIDNELYQLKLETGSFERKGHTPNQGRPRQDIVRTTQTRTRGYYTSNRPEAMHLDSIAKGKWKVENKREGSKSKDLVCYGCGKKGHFARDCRSKNKVTRHIAVIGRYADDNDAWEYDPNDAWIIDAAQGAADDFDWEVVEPESSPTIETIHEKSDEDESDKENQDPFSMHPGTRVDKPPRGGTMIKLGTTKKEIREATMGKAVHTAARRNKGQACRTCRNRRVRCIPNTEGNTCLTCIHYERQCIWPDKKPLTLESEVPIPTEETTKKIELRLRWEKLKEDERNGRTIVRCVPPGEECYAIAYDDDWRNPLHGKRHYTACYYDYCDTHYQIKWDTSHFPEPRGKCRWQYYDCQKDICKDHLWDKRTVNYFPGHTDLQVAVRNVIFNGNCQNERWQTCMNPECERHAIQKKNNGFDEKSFLERNLKLNLKVTSPPLSNSDKEETEYAATSGLEHSQYE